MSEQAKLSFFTVMAFVVGVALLVLTTHMVLAYTPIDNHVLDWWAMPHGFLYMVYLVAVMLLGFEQRWGIAKMVGVMLAGTVPFLSFVVERRVTRAARAQLQAGRAGAAPPAGSLAR